jgi:hypothetical protein
MKMVCRNFITRLLATLLMKMVCRDAITRRALVHHDMYEMYRYAVPLYAMIYMKCTGTPYPSTPRHIYEMYRYAVPRYTMIYMKCTGTLCHVTP